MAKGLHEKSGKRVLWPKPLITQEQYLSYNMQLLFRHHDISYTSFLGGELQKAIFSLNQTTSRDDEHS